MAAKASKIAAVGVLPIMLIAQIALAEHEAAPPYMRVIGGRAVIGVDRAIGDLLAIDGDIEIAGVVRGHVYALDSKVVVRSSAVILKPITINRGSLSIEDGAVLPESISVTQAEVSAKEGTPIAISETKLSTAAVSLMKTMLPFDRFSPPSALGVRGLSTWGPGLGLELKKNIDAPKELTIGGVTKLSFVSGKVRGAFQRGYKGARGTVLLSVVQLEDETAAKALWSEIDRIAPSAKVAMSVRTALGDGAHWFFRRKGRHAMLWRQGVWFIAVETKLAEEETTFQQEKQFMDQVLAGLRYGLEAVASTKSPAEASVRGGTR
jgi:hypothetical protein